MIQQPREETAEFILGRESEFVLPTYPRLPTVFRNGQGVYLWDTDGRRYLDLMSGLGVSALGHAHPRMIAAMTEQAGQLIHLSNLYSHRCQGELAEKLCGLSGMSAAFFSTGGAEAVESALKLSRAWARKNFSANKRNFVALERSYHGRSYGALSVTGQPRYREPFGSALEEVRFVPRNNIVALREAVDDSVCAILIEPILGEGGVHECTHEFLAEARRLADAHNALLVFDEIQCGLGRTGRWFAFEQSGVKPDLLVIGKPLGGGLPLSAFLVASGKGLRDTLGPGQHGSTLGGSPLACRMALEFLAIVEEDQLLVRVQQTGAQLRRLLLELADDFSIGVEARGTAGMQAIELTAHTRPIVEEGLGEGLLLNSVQGHILRFLPPYIMEPSHVDELAPKLRKLLKHAEKAAQPLAETAHATTVPHAPASKGQMAQAAESTPPSASAAIAR
jgi:acetylornithine/N-succinyldiaminopimelate aminotransferase